METNKNQDPRKKFTETLVTQMENEVAPWQFPRPAGFEMPFNADDGAMFHPFNGIKLMVASIEKGYADPRWMTYEDAQKHGYQVGYDQASTMIEKWQRTEWVPQFDRDSGEPVLDEKGKQQYVEKPLPRPKLVPAYLFNAQQIEGMPPYSRVKKQYDQHRVENLLRQSMDKGGVRFEPGSQRSFFSPTDDTIRLRAVESYPTRKDLHLDGVRGLGEWFAAGRRLNLNSNEPVGTVHHARDQIRHEIFSMLISSEYGLPHVPAKNLINQTNVIKVFKNNPDDLRILASEASTLLNKVMDLDPQREIIQKRVRQNAEPPRIIPRSIQVFKETQPLTPSDELKAFAKDIGVTVPQEPVLNGERQEVFDESRNVVATYQGLENGPVHIQNTLTGQSAEWLLKGYHLSTDQQRDLMNAGQVAREVRSLEQDTQYRQSAQECTEHLANALLLTPESTDLPTFLSARGLNAHKLYLAGEDLLLPAQDVSGKVWSYQKISPDGTREFPAGTRSHGCMAIIGGNANQLSKEKTFLVAESYESGVALHEAGRKPVVVAFSPENMNTVAKELQQLSPGAQVIMYCDRSSLQQENYQRERAMVKAATELGARIVNPIGSAKNYQEVVQTFDRHTLKNEIDRNAFKKDIKTPQKARVQEPELKQKGMER